MEAKPGIVYMDNHATTRVDPRVLDAMLPYFSEQYGNAASRTHAFGWTAEAAVDEARSTLGRAIGASSREIVFTSGATESNNLALKGCARLMRSRGDHLVTVATEHPSVLDPCRRLEQEGFRLTVLPVDAGGLVDPGAVEAALGEKTVLVSVMAANNEIGVLQPIEAIGRICRARGVLFHTDAAQAFGKIAMDVEASSIDLMSLSAHKLYGPKGIGALYVRRARPRVRLEPLFDGGGHERGLRSGTLDVPGIVGFGKAAALALGEMEADAARIGALRDRLLAGLEAELGSVPVNGHRERRLPGNLNVSFDGVDGDALVGSLGTLALSTGSACSSATLTPSHVLLAVGASTDRAQSSVRFGLGRFNTAEDVERAIDQVAGAVRKLRRAAAG